MAIDDGGAALPSNCDPKCSVPRGMSLRAYMATHILSGLMAYPEDPGDDDVDATFEGFAARAVKQADALIAALKE